MIQPAGPKAASSVLSSSLAMVKPYRRRIKTEEKAKVAASVWGTEFILFLAALSVLPRTILKTKMNS